MILHAPIKAGATSQTIDVELWDSSSTTGAKLAGLTYDTVGLVASYRRGATGPRTAITLATQTVGGAYSAGGFAEIDATNMKGLYRLDLPDSAVATGAPYLVIELHGAANLVAQTVLVPLPVNIESDSYNRLGTPAGASVSADIAAAKSDTAAILLDTGTDGVVIVNDGITAAKLAADAITEIQNGLSTLNAAAVRTAIGLAAANLDTQLATIAAYIDTEIATILAAVDAEITAILADTNELQTDWVNGGRLDLLLDAISSKTGTIGAVSVTISSPVKANGDIEIVRGDDYLIVDGRSIDIIVNAVYSNSSAMLTVSSAAGAVIAVSATGTAGTGSTTYQFEVPKSASEVVPGTYDYDAEITTSSGSTITPQTGLFEVLEDFTRP